MAERTSNKKMRVYPAPASPHVGAVISQLLDGKHTVSSLATQAQLDRRAIQRIRDGLEAPSPESLGRLCAVVTKEEAAALISAYAEDVHGRVLNSQKRHTQLRKEQG